MNRSAILSIFFILLFAASCATTGTGDRAQQAGAHYKLGIAYLSDNRIQQAFVEFHKAYELSPDDKETLNAIGIIYLLHFDDMPKAIEYFEKAARVDPGFSDVYNNLGYAYEKMGKFEKAISYYKKALSNPLYPTAEKAYVNMGNSYYRLARYAEAETAFKEAIKRAPSLGPAYMRLSLCYNAMGKYGDAAAAMAMAIDLDSLYKGNREMAVEDLNARRLRATGYEEQDIRDYLEILKY